MPQVVILLFYFVPGTDHMKLLCFAFQGCFTFFTALFSYFCVLCSRLTCFVLYWLHCLCPVLDACVTPHCIVCAISYRVNVCVTSSQYPMSVYCILLTPGSLFFCLNICLVFVALNPLIFLSVCHDSLFALSLSCFISPHVCPCL